MKKIKDIDRLLRPSFLQRGKLLLESTKHRFRRWFYNEPARQHALILVEFEMSRSLPVDQSPIAHITGLKIPGIEGSIMYVNCGASSQFKVHLAGVDRPATKEEIESFMSEVLIQAGKSPATAKILLANSNIRDRVFLESARLLGVGLYSSVKSRITEID